MWRQLQDGGFQTQVIGCLKEARWYACSALCWSWLFVFFFLGDSHGAVVVQNFWEEENQVTKNWRFTSKTVEDEFVRYCLKPPHIYHMLFWGEAKKSFQGSNQKGIQTPACFLWQCFGPLEASNSNSRALAASNPNRPPPITTAFVENLARSVIWDVLRPRPLSWMGGKWKHKKNAEVSYDLLVPFCTEGTTISAFHQCRVLLTASPRKIRIDVLYIYIYICT